MHAASSSSAAEGCWLRAAPCGASALINNHLLGLLCHHQLQLSSGTLCSPITAMTDAGQALPVLSRQILTSLVAALIGLKAKLASIAAGQTAPA